MVATNSYSQWFKGAYLCKVAYKSKNVIVIDGNDNQAPQTVDDNSRPSKCPRLKETQPIPRPSPTPKTAVPRPRPTPKRIGPQRKKVCDSYSISSMCL